MESECVETLSVFWMAKQRGYEPKAELSTYLKARSVLSDMLINDIAPMQSGRGEYATESQMFFELSADDKGFSKLHGNEVPLIFDHNLDYLEKRYRYPFTGIYRYEWVKTFEYAPQCGSSLSYFVGSERDLTGAFNSQIVIEGGLHICDLCSSV